jgi:transcription elongation factor GreB
VALEHEHRITPGGERRGACQTDRTGANHDDIDLAHALELARTRRLSIVLRARGAAFDRCATLRSCSALMARTRTRPDESGKPSYITPEGYRRLEEEAHQLWTVERPKLTKAVAIAAAEGDRSENAEYIYGKRKLFEIDRRLKFLGKRLEVLKIVDGTPTANDRVFFGAWVTVEDEEGARHVYRIVGPDETDVNAGGVSCESPMGKALLGRERGDEVVVPRPKGAASFSIEAISFAKPT